MHISESRTERLSLGGCRNDEPPTYTFSTVFCANRLCIFCAQMCTSYQGVRDKRLTLRAMVGPPLICSPILPQPLTLSCPEGPVISISYPSRSSPPSLFPSHLNFSQTQVQTSTPFSLSPPSLSHIISPPLSPVTTEFFPAPSSNLYSLYLSLLLPFSLFCHLFILFLPLFPLSLL